jgi:cytoplasmic tRNA 2-thiolation protein 1
VLARPRDGSRLCKECFFTRFEDEVHATIVRYGLLKRGERVAIAASGGKGAGTVAAWFSGFAAAQATALAIWSAAVDAGVRAVTVRPRTRRR